MINATKSPFILCHKADLMNKIELLGEFWDIFEVCMTLDNVRSLVGVRTNAE